MSSACNSPHHHDQQPAHFQHHQNRCLARSWLRIQAGLCLTGVTESLQTLKASRSLHRQDALKHNKDRAFGTLVMMMVFVNVIPNYEADNTAADDESAAPQTLKTLIHNYPRPPNTGPNTLSKKTALPRRHALNSRPCLDPQTFRLEP